MAFQIYEIYVIDEAFFCFVEPLPEKVRKCLFPPFLLNIEANPLTRLCSLSIYTMSQTNKDYAIKIHGMMYLLPHCQGPRHWGQNAYIITKTYIILTSAKPPENCCKFTHVMYITDLIVSTSRLSFLA